MTELLNNAQLGWQNLTDAGKLSALLAASLIFLWMSYKRVAQKTLLIYTTVTAVCCIFPITAVGLMLYQTKFYDYQWIWSLVPVTAVTAYGAVCFMNECWPDLRPAEWRKGVPVFALLLAVLFLSSAPGENVTDKEEVQRRAVAESTLEQLQAEMQGQRICLWAPAAILEYMRDTDASIELLYGRNMWDEWLNAYSYDTYSEDIISLYRWMEETASGEQGENKAFGADIARKVDEALRAGANCILLPEKLDESVVRNLEKTMHIRIMNINGYYLLIA